MSSFRIEHLPFRRDAVEERARIDTQLADWPVVYVLDGAHRPKRLYVGETNRAQQPDLGDYDLRFFDDVGAMRAEIRSQDRRVRLARLVAGYAWDWVSNADPSAFDIELDGERMRWNKAKKDWINSPGALEEVGSIHTVQGYDLNYAGVIIGPDLRVDAISGEIVADRESYRDKKGKERTGSFKNGFSDADLTQFIRNIYGVLLTRGIRGTYVYVCDPALRERLRTSFSG